MARRDDLLYEVWRGMRRRCNMPGHKDYKNYGGRGIGICRRWDDFEAFREDVGVHPGKGWSFDRVDNDGDYEPGNWKWSTQEEQVRNRRGVILDKEKAERIRELYGGGGYSQRLLADMFGCSEVNVWKVLHGEKWR